MFAEMLKTWLLHHNNQPTTISNPWREFDIDDIPELRVGKWRQRIWALWRTKPISLSKQALKGNPCSTHNKSKRKVHILRYATNQPSFFIEKQSEPGSVLISEIILMVD
jgi:hypothetical protein